MIDFDNLQKMIDEGFISVQKHPLWDLYIYNYTQKCQFAHEWNNETLQCRGLIMDDKYNIVARPFVKFFNYEEHCGEDSLLPSLPNERFEVFDKLDGSLGIMYWVNDLPYIATRGSFVSDQAIMANKMLAKYKINKLDKKYTYLFEIIYPENRIVIDYGFDQDLVLLAIIDTQSGEELDIYETDVGFPKVNKFDGIKDFTKVRDIQRNNAEGFVIRFSSGVRTKLKYSEYVRLHRLLTGITARRIWECLRAGTSIKPMTENVPEEFLTWVKQTSKDLGQKFALIMAQTKKDYKYIIENINIESPIDLFVGHGFTWQEFVKIDRATKKQLNELFSEKENSDILQAIHSNLEGKEIADMVWKKLKPAHEVPFVKTEVE